MSGGAFFCTLGSDTGGCTLGRDTGVCTLGSVVGGCKSGSDTGVRDGGDTSNVGSVGGMAGIGTVVGCTGGVDCWEGLIMEDGGDGNTGNAVMRFKDSAILSNALRVTSPDSRVGTVDEGGTVKIETISNAA